MYPDYALSLLKSTVKSQLISELIKQDGGMLWPREESTYLPTPDKEKPEHVFILSEDAISIFLCSPDAMLCHRKCPVLHTIMSMAVSLSQLFRCPRGALQGFISLGQEGTRDVRCICNIYLFSNNK